MRPPRLSIAGILALVAVIALGTAALVYASPAWVVAVQLGTFALLFASILGAVRGPNAAWWRGVAVFGWGILVIDNLNVWWVDSSIRPATYVSTLSTKLYPIIYHSPPMEQPGAKGFGGGSGFGGGGGGFRAAPANGPAPRLRIALFSEEHRTFQTVATWLVRLLFALLGGFVGRAILSRRPVPEP